MTTPIDTPGQPGQGGVDDGAPGDGQGPDFEKSYNELQPEYTRSRQELAQTTERLSEYEALFEALQDPDTQAEALSVLGFEPAETGAPIEDVDTSDWTDPLEEEIKVLRGQVDEMRSKGELEAEQREAAELIDLRDEYIGEAITYIEQQTDRKFTEKQERVLGNLAIANEGQDGIPDVQLAYNLLYGEDGVLEAERERWIDTKNGAVQAPGGRTAPAMEKPTNRRERTAYIDERIRAIESQQ